MGDRKLLSVFGFAAVCGLLAFTGRAEAQSMEGEDAKTHNGFYLQLTGGLGYLTTSGEEAGSDVALSSFALDTSIMLGGSPMPGLAIGGGMLMDYGPSPSATVDGNDVGTIAVTSQYLFALGVFGDFYPDPAGGLHFQAFAGFGGLERSFDGDAGGSDPVGPVFTIAGGYDVFISDEWSVGGLFRLGVAPLSINDVSYTSIAPALLVNLTYN